MPEHSSTPIQKIEASSYETRLELSTINGFGGKAQRLMRVGSVSLLVAVFAQAVGMLHSTVDAQNLTSRHSASSQLGAASGESKVAPTTSSLGSEQVRSNLASFKNDSEASQVDDGKPAGTSMKTAYTAPDLTTRLVSIPFKKVIQLSRSEAPGDTKVVTNGVDGTLEKTFRVTTGRHGVTQYDFVSQRVIKQPTDMEVLAGYNDRESRVMPSRSGVYNRSEELDLVATGYSPSEGPGHGICATGMRAGYGVVAVDPRVIPLHSKLYISGYGYAVAGDTGGAIKGHRIDLGQNTWAKANDVGRRHVHVYLLSTP